MKYVKTKIKKPTRRGVIWLGQTCNLRCYFCYFADRIKAKNHPEHPFFSIEKAKEICKIQREVFNLNSIDIQGGEPTIYPYIFELLEYCNQIKLKPTLITNALKLSDYSFVEKLKNCVYDLLISIQGIEDQYDKVVQVKGAFKRHVAGIENAAAAGISLRANLVLTLEILEKLEEIVNKLLLPFNFSIINFLGYNDWGDQDKKGFQKSYDLIIHCLLPIIDELENKGKEVNIRFLPFCLFPEKYRKNIQNSKQKIYDIHEWDLSTRLWIDRAPQRRAEDLTEPVKLFWFFLDRIFKRKKFKYIVSLCSSLIFRKFKKRYNFREEYFYLKPIEKLIIDWYRFPLTFKMFDKNFTRVECFYFDITNISNINIKLKNKCDKCDINFICDGVHRSVINHWEPKPVKLGEKIYDPNYYSKYQYKLIEEIETWYFEDV